MKLALSGTLLTLTVLASARTETQNLVAATGQVFFHHKPLPNAEVFIIEQDASNQNPHNKRTTTDKTGHYFLPGPWLATDHIFARRAGFTSAPTLIGTKSRLIVDRPTATISGWVKRDDGKPAANVLVILGSNFKGAICTGEETHTDSKGRYTFQNENGDLDNFSINALPDNSGYQEGTPYFYLEPGQSKQLAAITLKTRDGIVEGTVIDAKNYPVPNAAINPEVGYTGTTSDANGHFRLSGIARGEVNLTAQSPNSAFGETFTKTGSKGVVIKLNPPNQAEATLPEPAFTLAHQSARGDKAPKLQVSAWLKNSPVSIAKSKGKVVVLDFWSVTCGPCIKAFPQMERIYQHYKSKGLVVVGICLPEATPKIRRLIQKGGLTYPNAVDGDNHESLSKTAKTYPFQGTPTLVVIDQKGRITWAGTDVEGAEHWARRELGLFR